MSYLLLVIGLALLIWGADGLVAGGSAIAKSFGVSELIIGLTIIALGTSIPELFVNVLASIQGQTDIAIGNVMGSNIVNVLLILGCTALITPLPVQRQTVLSEIPISIAAALLIGFLANTILFYEAGSGPRLSTGDGWIILFFFLLFSAYIWTVARENLQQAEAKHIPAERNHSKKAYRQIILGMLMLFLGGRWVVTGAIALAQAIGMSEHFIGLTVVAIGTSLPEFVTSVRAARKGNTDIAVGNIVGSNIFNILWILGCSTVIVPLPFNAASNLDIAVVVGASCLILVAMIVGKRMVIGRWEGGLFVLVYFLYLSYLLYRS